MRNSSAVCAHFCSTRQPFRDPLLVEEHVSLFKPFSRMIQVIQRANAHESAKHVELRNAAKSEGFAFTKAWTLSALSRG